MGPSRAKLAPMSPGCREADERDGSTPLSENNGQVRLT
jgi:hypothetical protein